MDYDYLIVGVNPSLTIAALAERCMSLIPARQG